jgi:hypothetical protein
MTPWPFETSKDLVERLDSREHSELFQCVVLKLVHEEPVNESADAVIFKMLTIHLSNEARLEAKALSAIDRPVRALLTVCRVQAQPCVAWACGRSVARHRARRVDRLSETARRRRASDYHARVR